MSDPNRILGLDDSPERDKFREHLASCARAEGLLMPVTDEEIDRFEREYGHGPAVSEEFIATMTRRVLERLEEKPLARGLRLRPLWASAAAAAGFIAAMHRNEGSEEDPEAAQRLEEHRRRLHEATELDEDGDGSGSNE